MSQSPTSATSEGEILTKAELASRLKVTPRTIAQMVVRRQIPFIRLNHNFLRFNYARVLEALHLCQAEAIGRKGRA